MIAPTRIVIFIIFLFAQSGFSQKSYWKYTDELPLSRNNERRVVFPDKYTVFSFDFRRYLQDLLINKSKNVISERFEVPMPDGEMVEFELTETPVFEPALMAKYPGYTSFTGQAIFPSQMTIKLSVSPFGIHAAISGPSMSPVFIDPLYQHIPDFYQVYYKKDYRKKSGKFTCGVMQDEKDAPVVFLKESDNRATSSRIVGDCVLRSYRLALACTGEYAKFHGGTVEKVLAAYNATMTRVNGVYERDAAITMKLIADTDKLIFLNPNTDPYTNNNGDAMLDQNQRTIDNIIGASKYDIGHVFSTGGGGIAQLRSPCTTNKAMGVTGQEAPVGDPFDIDYVAHEMGHQFGANHTQNNSCQRNGSTAVEPGSASTIMGYAGICDPNVQNNSDAHFHGVSLAEIANFVVAGTGNTCAVKTTLNNQKPQVSLVKNSYTIPISTAFFLRANGSDADGDQISYCWEQTNNEVATMPPRNTNTAGPLFRSLPPSSSPVRYFPDLLRRYNTWEVLPSVNRTINFRCTVRDNNPLGGCTSEANVEVKSTVQSGPFLVTYPNTTSVSWLVGSKQVVRWDVAKTDVAPVNSAIVDIFLSVDGGATYPYVLATGVPNDGEHEIETPGFTTTRAKVMVASADNIFFDVSNANFRIVSNFTLDSDFSTLDICDENVIETFVSLGKVQDITQPVELSLSSFPDVLSYSFSLNPVPTVPSKSLLLLSGIQSLQPGYHDIVISAVSGTERLSRKISLFVGEKTITGISPLSPEANSSDVSPINTLFSWKGFAGFKNYLVEISTSPAFDVLEFSTVTSENNVRLHLLESKVYYWRIKPYTPCQQLDYSDTFSFRTSGTISGIAQILVNEALLVDKGQSAVIGINKLNVVTSNSKFVFFTITKKPVHGTIYAGNREIKVGNSFTLEDVENNLVTYAHNDDVFDSDDFEFNVIDDKNRWLPNNKFIIKIRQQTLGVAVFRTKNLKCFGDSDAELMAEGYGGIPPYTYSLDHVNYSNSPVFEGLPSGNYTIYIKDSTGDSASSGELNVSQPSLLTIDVSTDKYDILATASGGTGIYEFSIDNINYTGDKKFSDPGNGEYVVFVRDQNGCQKTSSVNINIPALSINAALTNDIQCAGQKAAINCTGQGGIPPYTYSADGITFQASPLFSLNAGNYIMRIKDAGGKINFADSLFTANPAPIDITLQQKRFQVIVKASGGTGSLQYSNNGINYTSSDTINFPENGTYRIYVRDEKLCVKSINISLNVLTEVISNVRNISCPGGKDGFIRLQPTNGTLPFQYSLNGSDFSAVREWSNLAAGEYTYQVKDNKNDTISGEIIITQPDSLILDLKIQNQNLEITVTGGTPPYRYSIDNGLVYLDINSFNDLPENTYAIAVIDKNGCIIRTSATISSSLDYTYGSKYMVNPNPFDDQIKIVSHDELTAGTEVFLYTTGGILWYSGKVVHNTKVFYINSIDVPKGVYLLCIKNSQHNNCKMVVKYR